MFDLDDIPYNSDKKQFTCVCICDTEEKAKDICAKHNMFVNELHITAEIYRRGNVVVIGAYKKEVVEYAAKMINGIEFKPPLNVTIFWGHHREGLQERWCIGFDVPNADYFVQLINSYGPMFCADQHPYNWQDQNNNTYSVVMLTNNLNYERGCNNGIEQFKPYLDCISNVTDRICKVTYPV